MHVRAMVLTADKLFVAGPLGEGIISPEAYEGRLGSALVVIDPESGEAVQSIRLPFLPAFDGMSVDGESLLLVARTASCDASAQQVQTALQTFEIGEPIDFQEDFEPWPERMVQAGSHTRTRACRPSRHQPARNRCLCNRLRSVSSTAENCSRQRAVSPSSVTAAKKRTCCEKLPQPLTGKVTLSVSVQIASAWGRTHQNGFLVFGNGEDNENLIKCGPQFVVSSLGTADGQPVKQSRKEPITIEFKPDTAHKLTVVYDTEQGKIHGVDRRLENRRNLESPPRRHHPRRRLYLSDAATTFTDFTFSAE
jgi:hypothetical protein